MSWCSKDHVKRPAMRTASSLAITMYALASASAAFAQTSAPLSVQPETAPKTDTAPQGGDIVVTGSRVIRDGYKAPTPTTVIGAADIAAKAPANIADLVNQLPAFSSSITPLTAIGGLSGGVIGINALNLRGLGSNRTLVLLDGQRVGASTLNGWVDVNQFPQALIKRVDVVTGGASAAWGSDAVAGVANFVLDKDFTGVKGNMEGGVTTYGDNRSYNLSLTAGARFAGGRGHILFSAEQAHNDGISGVPRDWYNGAKIFTNPNYTATNGQPQLLALPNVGFATATPGGVITSGPLKGTYFGPGGTPTQFNYGPTVSGNFMQGGQWQYADFAKSGDLAPRLSRTNVFGRASFDVTDHFQIFGQGSYSRSTSYEAGVAQFNFANITIQPDNAFIPASIASKVTGPFTLGTLNQDPGPIIGITKRSSWRAVVGGNGDFNALGTHWTWDVYGQRTVNNIYAAAIISITANYNRAIDAVRNANGAIVCRSTLTDPTNGCVPYDIFGTGVVSQAARDYVLGTSYGRSKLTEDVYAGTLRGEPFSTWAGPVSIATGIEHRREAVSGSNDPLSQVNAYFAGNYKATFGSYNVTEGFFETVVPLAKDLPFAKSLDLNAAVRATSYSTSGYVTTWKVGATYNPVDDITFRVTRSRDIRAPNLSELYNANQTNTFLVSDPSRGGATSTTFQVTQGNVNLKPEVADTLGLGVVLQPRFLPGFAASVDYYNIDIKNAIQTVTAQVLVNQCYSGNTALCSAITRDASGNITSVVVQPINLARQIARGLDFEASYRHPLLDGSVTLRALATRFLKNYLDNGINPPTDTVGTNSENGTANGVTPSLPKWRYSFSVGWEKGPLATLFTARGVSAGYINTSYIQCTSSCPVSTTTNMTINNNHVPGAIYFDANVNYKVFGNAEIYLAVDNIADKDPPQIAYGPSIGAAPISVNPALYDTLGRTFRLGFRFKL